MLKVDYNCVVIKKLLIIILMNAAPALVACQKATTLKTAFEEAGQILDSGAPAEKLEKLVAYTKELAE